ncbi:DegT/DnrJ/EryC1/StrS family aminotransferase [Yeosuana marina]|uniref:DegT/DnrJ/EryC1/StrS family aminotransferase n=1 Tax=Yeosuana marina TaxID=1565536 RepID=UPI0030ED0F08|tara:strand:- start:2699 stop:3799 length:1101 start_codon:yes stop_codon:yes gene_type:complete
MIHFLDLHKINEQYHNEFKNEFGKFLNSGRYILGTQVELFEKEYADFCGTTYCVGISNGLDALRLIFEAYKTLGCLKNGDEVIVPANTYIASILAISNSGLKPILVEPNLRTFNIDITKIEQAISPKTKAVLGVHLYGQLYDVKQMENICNLNNLILIEDAAQAHGAVYKDGRKAGNVSSAAAFSFYPTKNLGALGDAGAITTNNKELVHVILKLRNYGRTSTYKNDFKGYNCRLDELQATFLRIKLKHLDADNTKRRNLAKLYLKTIKSSSVLLPSARNIDEHVFHLFAIRCHRRDELKKYLYEKGVETLIHYPIPIHKQTAYKELSNSSLPISEQLSETILSLPINTSLSKADILKIVTLINVF